LSQIADEINFGGLTNKTFATAYKLTIVILDKYVLDGNKLRTNN